MIFWVLRPKGTVSKYLFELEIDEKLYMHAQIILTEIFHALHILTKFKGSNFRLALLVHGPFAFYFYEQNKIV